MSAENRIAIITGAAGGIGQALSREFVRAGWKIGITDVNRAALETLAGTLGGHALVNNAALGMGLVRQDHFTQQVQIEDISTEMWQRFVAVNLSGPFFMAKAAMPGFRAQKYGRIINVTTSFLTMLRGGFSPYGPAKAGLEAWSSSLSAELKDTGITVNVVVPGGPTDTPMVPAESGYSRQSMIRPEQLAPPMLFLCSEAGGAVTGHRFVAANWDALIGPAEAAEKSGAPIGWPDLARTTAVFPGGAPAL